jgi:DNA-binding CsgD family transcriptional regulator
MEMHRSRCAWFEGDAGASVAAAERALALAEPFGPSALLFDIHVRLAQFHQQVSNRPDAARSALEAADSMRDVAAPDATIRFLNARGMMHASDWHLDAFVRDYDEAVAIAERIGHVELLVSTQTNLALNALLTGLPVPAVTALEASIATSYEFGLGWHVPNELLSLARVRYVFGDIPAARRAMVDALASAYEARRLDVWVAAYGIPIALAAQDDALLAQCSIDGVLDAALASGDAWAIALTGCAYADLAQARGDAAGARDAVSRALDALGADARPLHLCAYVAQFGRDEDLARARALLDAHERDRSRGAERALFDAHVAARRRRRGESAQRALEAAQLYGGLHYVLRQAHALELAGRESDALRIYRDAASARDVARLESSSRAADPLAPLTPREREIAGLVLAGRSNREAGEELGLSERTVGNHLQSVFNRLGIGSRRELAELARPSPSE